jgi:hypothetical protein
MHLKMNIQGDTIPRAIQVSTHPTQFILVFRFKVAGDNSLYSFLLSKQAFHSAISIAQGNTKINVNNITTAAHCCGAIKAVPQELCAYA